MICLITTICVAISAVFAKKTKNAEMRLRKVERMYGGDFLLAFSGLLACVAMADEVVTADEVMAVERIFSNMGLTESEHAMCVGNFMMAQHKAHDAKRDAATISAKANRTACQFLHGLLWKVAQADGTVSESEQKVLDEIGEALGIGAGTGPRPLSAFNSKALEAAGVPPSLGRLAN